MDRVFFENFGALDKGVILPTCDVDKTLNEMSPEDARKAKRKWRKLMRQAKRNHSGWYGDKRFLKHSVRNTLSTIGKALIDKK